jgi:Cu(I)/Ag(I) efflux system membrane fusion protein
MNMKTRIFTLALPALALLLSLGGCGDAPSPTGAAEQPVSGETALDHAARHLDPTYVCPMHPQIVRNEPGSCPICGMDLVEKTIAPPAGGETALEHAAKHLDPKYVCPMHPQIVKDEPGNCPICGMDLVEKLLDPSAGKHPAVSVSGSIVQSMGVRTAKVERGTLWKYIRTVGRVTYDETRLAHVHPRASGWMERLKVRAEGDEVKRGQVLGHFYSPDILSAQVDFLIALKQYQGKPGGAEKIDKARNLLRLLDVPDPIIRSIEDSRETRNTVPVNAPIDGIVTEMGIRDGMYVSPQTTMVSVADLSRVWVMVDIFENQLDWLKPGLVAEITVPALPGRSWSGKLEYIYPELNPRTRTLEVRLGFANPDLVLRPNMFTEVVIYGGPKHDALSVPKEALIVTGERRSVVKALGQGRFQPVDVVTGMQRGGKVEILSGLNEGDDIVVSGQFLIDSESSLQASFLRMSSPDTGAGN